MTLMFRQRPLAVSHRFWELQSSARCASPYVVPKFGYCTTAQSDGLLKQAGCESADPVLTERCGSTRTEWVLS
jgi:hypothetical protein